MSKEKKRDPIKVMLRVTIVLAVVAVAALLLPAFLPFNLLKGGLNAAGTFLLYRPLSGALQKSGLVPREESTNKGHFVGIALVAALLLATCILLVLAMQGVI